MQGKVGIVANSECRVEPDFGKYVSDSTICVASTTAFSCAVRNQFSVNLFLSFQQDDEIKMLRNFRVTSAVQ
jgi:hypothetical protein